MSTISPAHSFTNALLRTLGKSSISIRIPVNATSTDDASQLGITAPPTETVTLTPVLIRRDANKKADTKRHEILISASTLAESRQITTTADARTFFLSALGITVDALEMSVLSFEADEFSGAPYLYRIVVEE